MKVPFLVSPGSEQIHATIRRDGQMQTLESVGATVLANACGPCIGQWRRDDVAKGTKNSIITSFNRNFPARNDENPETFAFIASPEIVMAYGLAGTLAWNPLTDPVTAPDGTTWRLAPPKKAPELPPAGFVRDVAGYEAPAPDGASVEVKVAKGSQRLELLEPFPAWDGKDFIELPVLLKAKGKCTTDHISPAGSWLRYRGHLDKISDNMFLGALNAFTGEKGRVRHPFSEEPGTPAEIARNLRDHARPWIVVGDENYGEGSSREHAAMSPRHLGAAAILVKSFARIHESNLKKQGVLALTFADPATWDEVREGDRISLYGLAKLEPGQPVRAKIHHDDGSGREFEARHTLNREQIEWFKAGSALNLLAKRGRAA
jgi:aconitate hydratase